MERQGEQVSVSRRDNDMDKSRSLIMLLRKFVQEELESEPDKVLFKDLYPWDEIEDTPFGASLAIVEPGGQTMKHSHDPDETFIIFQGKGTMFVDDESNPIAKGDVVVMPSGSEHTIKNDSETEPLMFLSVFWWGDDTDTHSYAYCCTYTYCRANTHSYAGTGADAGAHCYSRGLQFRWLPSSE